MLIVEKPIDTRVNPDFHNRFPSCPPPDGLMDCVDPDCCEQLSCGSDPLCHGSADPLALLQQGPPPGAAANAAAASAPPTSTHAHSFYRRIRFLLGKAATHSLPGDVPFDTRCVCRRALSVCPCMPNTFSWRLF
ncbi:Teneurin-1 [Liparis tanakae]|uniref:Teneurin-1 n=1 Tax=Liparis tanakae TaxID=230148 RepID=A0A4Z2EI42_9TELE|nr:Teneurin-1 [Liparis tanakae]